MVLSSSELKKRIQLPKNKSAIAKAVDHENRVRFHSEKATGTDDVSPYLDEFLKKVKVLLPSDKYARFVNLLGFPLPTNELVDTVFSELSKVYDAQNKHISYQFSKIEYREDFANYLDWMEFNQFYENDCLNDLKLRPNCIQVIDLPERQTSRLPEPYVYNLPIDQVIDIDTYDDGNISLLIFSDDGNRIVAIDDVYYRVFEAVDGDRDNLIEISEAAHELGYAPCRFLMTDSLNTSSNIVKISAITKSLWPLDRLLFKIIAKENLEDYAAFPIYSVYDDPCTYTDPKSGVSCNSGILNLTAANGNLYTEKCPACKDNFFIGPGSILTSRPPKSNTQPDLLKQVEVTPAEVESLKYNKESVEERKAEILQSCVGSDPDQLSGQAQNEKQILTTFETKQAVLMWLKKNIEKAMKFTIDTMATLRYRQIYLGCTVDFGTKFYLATSQQLNEKYEAAKKNGAPMFELDMLKSEIYANDYRNNPEQQERIEILKRLEPFVGLSISELSTLNGLYRPSDIDLIIKLNFAYFISKFEDTNGSITDFGNLLSMDRRVEIIKNQLIDYGNSELARNPGKPKPDVIIQ